MLASNYYLMLHPVEFQKNCPRFLCNRSISTDKSIGVLCSKHLAIKNQNLLHIKTSQLICKEYQPAGFSMKGTLVVNRSAVVGFGLLTFYNFLQNL